LINNSDVKTIHLKELILGNFDYKFKDFAKFVKYIQQLTRFESYGNDNIDVIDAKRWKCWIISSLSYLESFKFIFNYICKGKNNNILDKLKEFQTDF